MKNKILGAMTILIAFALTAAVFGALIVRINIIDFWICTAGLGVGAVSAALISFWDGHPNFGLRSMRLRPADRNLFVIFLLVISRLIVGAWFASGLLAGIFLKDAIWTGAYYMEAGDVPW
jgi:hypothetical protein